MRYIHKATFFYKLFFVYAVFYARTIIIKKR